jgi:RNA polymerase sigma factor (sigma-70 family)
MGVNKFSLTPSLSRRRVLPNLGLVDRLARQHRRNGLDLPEAIAIGNLALAEAARSYKRGLKEPFEAYAARIIKRAIARSLAAPPMSGGVRQAALGPEEHLIIRERLEELEKKLTARELRTLYLRFVAEKPLEYVSEQLKVSKEGARYIQNSALEKLDARTAELPSLKEKTAKSGPARTIEEIESIFAEGNKQVRDIVMCLAWQLLQDRGVSIHKIGRYFQIGPATVKLRIRATEARYGGDGAFRGFIDEVKARLGTTA